MYKPSTYLQVVYFLTYLPTYETYSLQDWSPRYNQTLTQFEVHPQLSNNGHPVDGWCAGGCWFTELILGFILITNSVGNESHV
jgi:hypothetical protein